MDDAADNQPPLSNRHRSMKPSRKHYCMRCDGAITSSGSKCPRCGAIGSKGRHRPLKTSDWRRL